MYIRYFYRTKAKGAQWYSCNSEVICRTFADLGYEVKKVVVETAISTITGTNIAPTISQVGQK